MKITDVETVRLDVPFKPRPGRSMARRFWRWSIIDVYVVKTDAGLVGYGETVVHYTWKRVEKEQIERVVGRSPFEFLWDDSLGAGLQMAIYDVAGKALGVPCYRLLGKKLRDWCPVSWWCKDMPVEDLVEEAKEAVRLGYTNLKLKARPWFDIIDQVQAVSNATPANFRMDLDFNGLLLNAGNAIRVLHELEEFPKVAIFEDPVPRGDIEGCRQVKAKVNRPVALHFGVLPILTVVKEDLCDALVLSGGVSTLTQQASVAAMANKPFWIQYVGTGLTTAFVLHLGAVLSHAQLPAITCHEIYSDDLLRNRIDVQGGYARVPEKPGLGVEVDEDALERFRVEPNFDKVEPEALYRFSRRDGSSTYYADGDDLFYDFLGGNQPVFERGVNLEVIMNDGSEEFARLRSKALSRTIDRSINRTTEVRPIFFK